MPMAPAAVFFLPLVGEKVLVKLLVGDVLLYSCPSTHQLGHVL